METMVDMATEVAAGYLPSLKLKPWAVYDCYAEDDPDIPATPHPSWTSLSSPPTEKFSANVAWPSIQKSTATSFCLSLVFD